MGSPTTEIGKPTSPTPATKSPQHTSAMRQIGFGARHWLSEEPPSIPGFEFVGSAELWLHEERSAAPTASVLAARNGSSTVSTRRSTPSTRQEFVVKGTKQKGTTKRGHVTFKVGEQELVYPFKALDGKNVSNRLNIVPYERGTYAISRVSPNLAVAAVGVNVASPDAIRPNADVLLTSGSMPTRHKMVGMNLVRETSNIKPMVMLSTGRGKKVGCTVLLIYSRRPVPIELVDITVDHKTMEVEVTNVNSRVAPLHLFQEVTMVRGPMPQSLEPHLRAPEVDEEEELQPQQSPKEQQPEESNSSAHKAASHTSGAAPKQHHQTGGHKLADRSPSSSHESESPRSNAKNFEDQRPKLDGVQRETDLPQPERKRDTTSAIVNGLFGPSKRLRSNSGASPDSSAPRVKQMKREEEPQSPHLIMPRHARQQTQDSQSQSPPDLGSQLSYSPDGTFRVPSFGSSVQEKLLPVPQIARRRWPAYDYDESDHSSLDYLTDSETSDGEPEHQIVRPTGPTRQDSTSFFSTNTVFNPSTAGSSSYDKMPSADDLYTADILQSPNSLRRNISDTQNPLDAQNYQPIYT